MDEDYYAPRRCFGRPPTEVYEAAYLLDRAAGAHLAGATDEADHLFRSANLDAVRQWAGIFLGGIPGAPDSEPFIRARKAPNPLPRMPKERRDGKRDPSPAQKREVIGRWGHNCAFCGVPVIRADVRRWAVQVYPDAVTWAANQALRNHAAFRCLWLQYDHVVPHSRGGRTEIDNLIVACALCNNGRGERTLDEVGLLDPRDHPIVRTSWDGLERLLATR